VSVNYLPNCVPFLLTIYNVILRLSREQGELLGMAPAPATLPW
jgi:hypothetical protein